MSSIGVNHLVDLLLRYISMIASVGVALTLTFLPGFAILNRFTAFSRIDRLSRLCIAPGISIALYVLLFASSFVLHIRLGWWTPWLIALIATVSLLRQRPLLHHINWTSDKLPYPVFALIVMGVLGSRLYAINDLVAPMWGDSVHHTLIVQLMIDNGGLFQSWQPYDDVATFTYHYGFHAFTTMYAWMRNMSAEFSVLMMGQIANFSAVIGIYALTRQLTKSVWGGVFAVIVGGFVSNYPFFFLYWGRYTQLTGHIVLLTALVLFSHYLKQPPRRENVAFLVLLPVIISGIGMAQYKVAVIFVVISVSLITTRFIGWYQNHRSVRYAFTASVGRTVVIASLAILLFMLRGWNIVESNLGIGVQTRINTEISPEATTTQISTFSDAITLSQAGLDNNTTWVWWIALAGMWIIVIERREALWYGLGAILCLIVFNPRVVGINRAGLVDNFHLSLTAYLFTASLSGLAIGTVIDALITRSRQYRLLVAIGCIGLSFAGLRHLPPSPPDSIFVLPDDVNLMQWIRDNVPPNDGVAALGFTAFKTFTAGRDAGWWIPYYTKHQTNLMIMAAAQEETGDQRRSHKELSFTQELYSRDMSSPASAEWLVAQGYRYFYIGAKPLTQASSSQSTDYATLVRQLLSNPALRVAHQSGEARLLVVK